MADVNIINNSNENTQESFESICQKILSETVQIANLLRESQNPQVNNDLTSIDRFTETLKDLGVVVSKRGAKGRFEKGGSDSAARFVYSSLIKEQRQVLSDFSVEFINAFKKELKNFGSGGKSRKKKQEEDAELETALKRKFGYSYNMQQGRDVILPKTLKNPRITASRYVDFFAGGRSPRQLDSYIAELESKNKESKNEKSILYLARQEKIKRLSKVRDFGDAITGRGLAIGLNKFSKGSVGWFKGLAAPATKFLLVQLTLAIGEQLATAAKESWQTLKDSIATSMAIEARGQRPISTKEYGFNLHSSMAMGASRKEFNQRAESFAELGLDFRHVHSSFAVEKAYGVKNSGALFQAFHRRTNLESKYTNDFGRAVGSLKPIARETGLTLSELSEATTQFMSSIKGAFDFKTIRNMLGKYGGFVRSGDMGWEDVTSIYNRTRDLPINQLLTFTKYAEKGGYNFKEGDLLGRAAELRTGTPQESAASMASAVKGAFLDYAGNLDIDKLSRAKETVLFEHYLPMIGAGGLERLPNRREILKKILSGNLDEETEGQIYKAISENQPYSVARSINATNNLIGSIRNILMAYVYGKGTKEYKDILKQEKKSYENSLKSESSYRDEKQKQPVNVNSNFNFFDKEEMNVTQETDAPGSPVSVTLTKNGKKII